MGRAVSSGDTAFAGLNLLTCWDQFWPHSAVWEWGSHFSQGNQGLNLLEEILKQVSYKLLWLQWFGERDHAMQPCHAAFIYQVIYQAETPQTDMEYLAFRIYYVPFVLLCSWTDLWVLQVRSFQAEVVMAMWHGE